MYSVCVLIDSLCDTANDDHWVFKKELEMFGFSFDKPEIYPPSEHTTVGIAYHRCILDIFVRVLCRRSRKLNVDITLQRSCLLHISK
jgi:hypothetical protein